MGRLREKVTQLTQSRLVRTLAVGFICIVIVDLFFIGILSVETVRTERYAAREAQMIRAAQGLSAMIRVLVLQRIYVDQTRVATPDVGPEGNQVHVRRVLDRAKTFKNEWKDAGLPTGDISRISNMSLKLSEESAAIFAVGSSKVARNNAYNAYVATIMEIVLETSKRLQSIHDAILAEEEPYSEVDPMILLLVAVTTNVVTSVLAAFFVVTRITRPISRLADNCKNLMAGRVIPEPTSDQPEIRMLETSFHQMSNIVAENENSRISFLKEMQEVQEVTLQHVQGYVEDLAESRTNPSAESIESFRLMKANIDGMLFLLSSMTYGLNFNIEEDIVLNSSLTSTTELLNNARNTVTWLMKRKRIELIVDDPAVELECDIRLIERVIVNLLSNAAKFSENRSKIRLSARVLDDGVRFSVRDYGCGISTANQEKLFKKFSQVEAVDGKQRAGSGLGLLICKNIVNAHGGEIICESIENEGTCFWFKLPFKCVVVEKASDVRSKEASRSIFAEKFTRNFIFLISAYLAAQVFFVLSLGSEFQHAKYLSSQYSRQKAMVLDTQEVLARFVMWRQTMMQAIPAGDIQTIMDMGPAMQKEQDLVVHMISLSEQDSKDLHRLKSLKSNFSKLGKTADNCVDAITTRTALSGKEFQGAFKLVRSIEGNLSAIFMEQNDGLAVTYDLSKTLRQDILNAFLFATIINATTLFALCWTGLTIVSKVTELNNKALQFAFGSDLVRTINGKDELAFLDERLCDVAQKVRTAQRQRQDLMAIINHDLRTPLGAFLNGLEMLAAGLIGEVSAEDSRLIEQAENDVRGVLNIIDEFLDTEKADFQAQ